MRRPLGEGKYIHQSQAALDPGNIYTSTAYEKTRKQYFERMNRLRNSNISNHMEMSPRLRGVDSRRRMEQYEYGQEFELQPKVRSQREQVYGTYGVSSRSRLDPQVLLDKYRFRENLNIYSKKGKHSTREYRHTEYHS